MPRTLDVALVVGSLRKGSFTQQVAHAIAAYPGPLTYHHVEIGSLPLYNEDRETEGGVPPEWIEFRKSIRNTSGVLFATPEYNRSIPGGLKNALDVGSRPYGQSAWDGKPAAVISVSPGAIGAFGANHHLRQALVFLNMPTMPQPEAYIGGANKLFDDSGAIKDPKVDEFLRKFADAFTTWVQHHQ